jgi:hypothetical protein
VTNHAIRLAEAGRWADALNASQQALDLYRESVQRYRDTYPSDLTNSVQARRPFAIRE